MPLEDTRQKTLFLTINGDVTSQASKFISIEYIFQ